MDDSSLVFPFLVYEAKGWTSDPREARLQAYAAGATYLNMLDALARRLGAAVNVEGRYKFRNSKCSGLCTDIFWVLLACHGRLQTSTTEEGACRALRHERYCLRIYNDVCLP